MKRILLLITIFSFCHFALAHNHDEYKGFDIKVTSLGDGIYELRTDRSGNVAVLIGDDGVLMVDTKMEHLVELIDSAQKQLSNNREVDLIINTHFHRDHVRGNAYFKKHGALIVAHNNVRQYMETPKAIKALGREAPSFTKEYYPSIGVQEGVSIKMNGQNISLHHIPNAHTESDLFVFFKEANVIHGGDLVSTGQFPFIDIDNGGSVKGFINGLQAIINIADEKTQIIAGHGPTATLKDLKTSISMLNETHSIIKKYVDQGLSLKMIKKLEPLAAYGEKWNWPFINTDRMTTIHYYDITGLLQ